MLRMQRILQSEIESKMNKHRFSKQNRKNRHIGSKLICLIMVLILSLLLCGCTASDNVYLNDAADAYKAGKYAEAEKYFLKAIRNGEKSVTVFSGYAFNQLKAGDMEGAEAILGIMVNQDNTYGDYFEKEPETGEAVRHALLEIYLSRGDYESAIALLKQLGEKVADKAKAAEYKASAAALAWRMNEEKGLDAGMDDTSSGTPLFDTDELIKLITESIEAGNENIKTYRMRADLYWIKGEWDLWEADERKIIELKDYAIDEYSAIYGMRLKEKNIRDVLSLVDEVTVYLGVRSAYIDDYGSILPMFLKAAEYADLVGWEHKSDYYFGLAEQYIELAEDRNISDNEILRYEIIIAEKKGKMELAYKLLGVYLEHCPDDRMAYKEQKYLENRLGVTVE